MAGETKITVVGNLTADPELRYTQSGVAVANFTVASTPREYDRATSSWKDGDTLFLRATVWRELAEHVAGSLAKGQHVVVTGTLKQRSYDDNEGNKRTAYEIEADEVGASLRYGTTTFARSARREDGGAATQPKAQAQAPAQAPAQPQAAPAPAGGVPDDFQF